jgi:hypothetical protein
VVIHEWSQYSLFNASAKGYQLKSGDQSPLFMGKISS